MKRLTQMSKTLLLAMMGLLVFASCQEEEVIPITQEELQVELFEEYGTDLEHEDVVVNSKGELVGYLDRNGNRLDLNKQPIATSPNARDDRQGRTFLVAYKDRRFKGKSISFNTSGTGFSYNGTEYTWRFHGSSAWSEWNRTISSIIVPAYTKVLLCAGTNKNGCKTYDNNGPEAWYSSLESSAMGDNSFIEIHVSFYPAAENAKQDFCGYAYTSTNYGGSRLAIFYNAPISQFQLNYYGYNNTIESMSFNSYGKCKTSGIGVNMFDYQYDTEGVVQGQTPFNPTNDIANFLDFRNRPSSIIPAGDYYLRERSVGMTAAEGNSYTSALYAQLAASDPSPYQLKVWEKNWCDMQYDDCINRRALWRQGLDYLGGWACPEINELAQTFNALKQLTTGDWDVAARDLAIAMHDVANVAGTSNALLWETVPEAKLAACLVVAASLVTDVYTTANCGSIRTDCYNALQ